MKYWVDPPDGWKYGFPKLWDKEAQPDWEKWILQQGYPSEMLHDTSWVRMWPAEKC